MATNVNAEFVIIGDIFDPNVVTQRLGIEPHGYWIKGEEVPKEPIKRKDTNWWIHTDYEHSFDIMCQLSKLINILQNKKNILKELKTTYDLDYLFLVVINVEEDEKPAIALDSSFITFASDIGAEFEVDLYIY
ncbi:DUF4279 domain-containing protein [Bacillus sp. REN10]|uniref:DUF4279 domain-containing protein n=1 Tax=Bacillus sp. REN10 TaxID=2782541 RepID=UPI00193C2206|nr:DUF4279 domain-containing protein [Bacillus sp. REN10]